MTRPSLSPNQKSRPAWRTPAIAAVTCLLITAALVGNADSRGIDVSVMLRDAPVEFDIPVYAGGISFIGITLLILTAGACGLASRISPVARTTLAGAAILSFVMAMDDQFMLHERVFKWEFGIPEEATLAAYALAGLALLIVLWTGPLRQWRTGLLVSLGLMATSILGDLGGASYVAEDLIKVAAFAAWCAFWVGLSWHCCTNTSLKSSAT